MSGRDGPWHWRQAPAQWVSERSCRQPWGGSVWVPPDTPALVLSRHKPMRGDGQQVTFLQASGTKVIWGDRGSVAGINSGLLRLDALWRHQWTGILGRGLPAATYLSFRSWASVARQLCRMFFCQLCPVPGQGVLTSARRPLACAQPTVAS